MKKPLKIAGVILAFFLVVIVALSLLIKSYLTEKRIRALVTETVEKSLHCKTSVGAIQISLFRGIVVQDFEIREQDAGTIFFRTKEFVLAYQVFPLLTGKMVIDQLGISDAEIHVKANPDGTYNFSGMAKTEKPEEPENGKESASGLPVALNVKAITVENAKLFYADAAGKVPKAEVILNAALKITGHSADALSSSGSFDILLTEALLTDGNKSLKNIRTTARYNIDVDLAAERLAIRAIDLDVLKIPVTISGTVNYASPTAYNLAVRVPDYSLSQIPQDLPLAFLPRRMTFGGNVSLLLNVSKKPDEASPPQFDGHIRMNRASCAFKNMNLVLDGTVKLTPDAILLEGLKLVASQNTADISGSVKNYREYPDVNVSVRSKFIALDDLLVPASAGSKEAAGPGKDEKSSQAKTEPGPMDLKLKVNATLDIDKTRYKGISITGFRSRYELKDNVFTVPYLKGNTLNGAFALKGAVNLAQKGTTYDMNADLQGIRVEDIINAFVPKAKGMLSGTLSGRAALNGAGTLPVNIKRNLKGSGQFTISNGALKNSELVTGLLAVLGLKEMKEIPIEKANSAFTVSGEIINLKTLIGSKDLAIDEKGTIGMDERLDLGVVVKVSDRLAPKLVSQSSAANFLSGEKGWTGVPLRVEGSISKPSYGIDTKAVGRNVTEGLQKKTGEELRNILQKDRKPSAAGEEDKSANRKSLIRDIFGR